jgi:hypothetical protein
MGFANEMGAHHNEMGAHEKEMGAYKKEMGANEKEMSTCEHEMMCARGYEHETMGVRERDGAQIRDGCTNKTL